MKTIFFSVSRHGILQNIIVSHFDFALQFYIKFLGRFADWIALAW
jgi:hypothetical protein